MRMVVLLPAPFGPKNPTTSPFSTSKLILSSARTDPKRLVRSLAWIITSAVISFPRNRTCRSGTDRVAKLWAPARGGRMVITIRSLSNGPKPGARTARFATAVAARMRHRMPGASPTVPGSALFPEDTPFRPALAGYRKAPCKYNDIVPTRSAPVSRDPHFRESLAIRTGTNLPVRPRWRDKVRRSGIWLAEQGPLHHLLSQMGREDFDERIHVPFQVRAGANANARRRRREQMRGVSGSELAIGRLIDRHAGDDPNPQAERNVGLDDVGIDSSQHYARSQALGGEGSVDLRAPSESKRVSHDRVGGHIRERQLLDVQDGMSQGRDHGAIPFVAGQDHQPLVFADGLRGDGQIRFPVGCLDAHLGRAALVQCQLNAWESLMNVLTACGKA